MYLFGIGAGMEHHNGNGCGGMQVLLELGRWKGWRAGRDSSRFKVLEELAKGERSLKGQLNRYYTNKKRVIMEFDTEGRSCKRDGQYGCSRDAISLTKVGAIVRA
jgi:hypothetical protein